MPIFHDIWYIYGSSNVENIFDFLWISLCKKSESEISNLESTFSNSVWFPDM